MRKDVLGIVLMLLGAGYLIGAALSVVGNTALGNPIQDGFLFELLAWGLGGAAVLVVGLVVLLRSLRRPVSPQPQPMPRMVGPPSMNEYRTPWSAIAFLLVLLLLAALYLVLVFVSAGIAGVLLQFVFFLPIIAVLLVLARWWSRLASPWNEPPTSLR